jgi:transposase
LSAALPPCCDRYTKRLLIILNSSTKLFAHETAAPVLDPGRGQTKTGRLFA